MRAGPPFRPAVAAAVAFSALLTGCRLHSHSNSPAAGGKQVIQNAGSDTMVNIAQAWAEEYAAVEPDISVEVSGGGSGTGIAALINGTVDVVNSSRKIEPAERDKVIASRGKEPTEFIAGYDALAVFVHRDNPLDQISIPELADIYREKGPITRWSQLGIQNTGCPSDELILVSRQSNSGTYHYFREAVVGKGRDFRLGTLDLHGSKDVAELIGRTPCAIGYIGMGYATPEVKALRIARQKGGPAYGPSVETTLDGTYPIARPLYLYTAGEPSPAVKKYIDWIFSAEGQRIVAANGYVPRQAQPADRSAVVGNQEGEAWRPVAGKR